MLAFVISLQLSACKHSHPVSESLKQAFEIQQQALQIAFEVDSLMMTLTDDSLKSSIIKTKTEWMKQKIVIEALEPHDHSKCNHDHSHDGDVIVEDEEMILVQKEWRDSIVAIKYKILSAK